ncbi:MAG: radical SAM/SPASM domain-containing protein [Candidatus Omnitrophota bacterium]|jgi:MoaA/NifB/PqqE/SkfB family radical SAM enzyme
MEMDVRQFSSDKILKHLDRINDWLKGGNPAPITVELDMTNICNHKCPECSGWYLQNSNKDSLSYGLAKEIVKQLARAQIRGLIFTGGGEPLCHPDIRRIVRLAHDLGLEIGFITNGSLINEEIGKVLLDSCTWLRFSLDAACSKTFRKVHGLDGEAFQKVINNIQLLVRMKKSLKSRTTIGIGYLTCNYTRDEMLDAAKLSRRLCVDYLQFRPMQLHNNGKFKYHLNDITEDINRCMKMSGDGFQVLYSKHKYDMMRDKAYGRNYEKCYGHQFATVIAANAKMYLCCHMRGFDKYCIGDLKKNTFQEIWNSSLRERVVENIDFNDCIPLCRDNTFNQILWNIGQPKEHINFL